MWVAVATHSTLIALFMLGCGAAPAAPGVAHGTAEGASLAVPAAPALPAASVLPVAAPAARLSARRLAAPEPSAKLALEVSQVLRAPVSSIALGVGSRVAVLSEPPQLADAHGFKPLPLPAALRPKSPGQDTAQIFFGRDNEPRVMGSRATDSGETAIYWRHTALGWRDGREEIGQLGGTSMGGLWGVLGGDDPELVCRCNALCIIKRSSGWISAPAGSAPRVVCLQGGVLWGLDASGIAGIDARGWTIAMPAPEWSAPRAFWATSGEAWVSAGRELFHFRGGAWASLASPIGEVTAFWGAAASSVWMVGEGGVAHFDGHGLRSSAAPGALLAVRGRSDDEVWLGGDAGLFRARLLDP